MDFEEWVKVLTQELEEKAIEERWLGPRPSVETYEGRDVSAIVDVSVIEMDGDEQGAF